MGLTCKQFGAFKGSMRKLDNELVKRKANKIKKQKGGANEGRKKEN